VLVVAVALRLGRVLAAAALDHDDRRAEADGGVDAGAEAVPLVVVGLDEEQLAPRADGADEVEHCGVAGGPVGA
jgi:hypothetical protein